MKYLLPIALLLAGCAADENAETPAAAPTVDIDAADIAEATAATNTFALELLRNSEDADVHVSPTSIAAAFGMAAQGARGETRTQMLDVLHLTDTPPAALAAVSKSADGFTLTVANAGWVDNGFPVEPGYVADVEQNFGGGFVQVDFADPAAAAQTINAWIAKNTADRITDLIDPGTIDPALTKLILTNTVYFKADWQQPFTKESTREADFKTPGGEVSVPQMRQTGQFAYADADGFAALRLNYAGDASMLVLLPDEGQSVDGMIEALDLSALDKALTRQAVVVGLPKFETRAKVDLRGRMQALSMTLAFTRDADFSGITTSEPLHIGGALHEVFIRVDEKGTEAAAATAVEMAVTSMPPMDMPEFIVDRPFAYLIRSADGVILFAGKVSDPR